MVIVGLVCAIAACVSAVRGEWDVFCYCLIGVVLVGGWIDLRKGK